MRTFPTYFLLLFTFLINNNCTAQNIKTVRVEVEYRKLPNKLLPADYQFYSVGVAADRYHLSQLGSSPLFLSSLIDIGGFKKVMSGGHFFIELFITPPVVALNASRIEKSEKKKKDKNGKEYIKTTYWWEHEMNFGVSAKIIDMNGQLLLDREIRSDRATNSQKVKGKSCDSYKKAMEDREKYSVRRIREAHKEELEESIVAAKKYINRQLGFPITQERVPLGMVGDSKDPLYDQWQRSMNNARMAFRELTANGGLSAYRNKIQASTKFWLTEKDGNRNGNKKALKIWHQATENLALAAFWGEDFSKAKSYAREIANQKYKSGAGKSILKEIEKVQKKMASLGATSRHFEIDIQQPSQSILNIRY